MIDYPEQRHKHSAGGSDRVRRKSGLHTIADVPSVAFTASVVRHLSVARERPDSPVIGLTPLIDTARPYGGNLGRARVVVRSSFDGEAVNRAARVALTEGFAAHGDEIVVVGVCRLSAWNDQCAASHDGEVTGGPGQTPPGPASKTWILSGETDIQNIAFRRSPPV